MKDDLLVEEPPGLVAAREKFEVATARSHDLFARALTESDPAALVALALVLTQTLYDRLVLRYQVTRMTMLLSRGIVTSDGATTADQG